MKLIICIMNAIYLFACHGRRSVTEWEKIKVYVESDVPKNADKIRLEYEFHPRHDKEIERHIYKDCNDVPTFRGSGVYNVNLNGKTKEVCCEINFDGPKYLVIQRRVDGSQDFYKTWKEYENGFGDIRREFWIGNTALHELTSQEKYRLRIDMEANDTTVAYADYGSFFVGGPETKYKLSIFGYSGSAGDSLTGHSGQMFSTYDHDNDQYDSNCAVEFKGVWWYSNCHSSNLNGKYYEGSHRSYADGVNWYAFRGHYESMKKVTIEHPSEHL